jgi:hypothetical protein
MGSANFFGFAAFTTSFSDIKITSLFAMIFPYMQRIIVMVFDNSIIMIMIIKRQYPCHANLSRVKIKRFR